MFDYQIIGKHHLPNFWQVLLTKANFGSQQKRLGSVALVADRDGNVYKLPRAHRY